MGQTGLFQPSLRDNGQQPTVSEYRRCRCLRAILNCLGVERQGVGVSMNRGSTGMEMFPCVITNTWFDSIVRVTPKDVCNERGVNDSAVTRTEQVLFLSLS